MIPSADKAETCLCGRRPIILQEVQGFPTSRKRRFSIMCEFPTCKMHGRKRPTLDSAWCEWNKKIRKKLKIIRQTVAANRGRSHQ